MSYISGNGTFQHHIFLIFQEGNFRAQKIKNKKTTLKKLLMFQEMELSSPKLKELLIFQEGTCKA